MTAKVKRKSLPKLYPGILLPSLLSLPPSKNTSGSQRAKITFLQIVLGAFDTTRAWPVTHIFIGRNSHTSVAAMAHGLLFCRTKIVPFCKSIILILVLYIIIIHVINQRLRAYTESVTYLVWNMTGTNFRVSCPNIVSKLVKSKSTSIIAILSSYFS